MGRLVVHSMRGCNGCTSGCYAGTASMLLQGAVVRPMLLVRGYARMWLLSHLRHARPLGRSSSGGAAGCPPLVLTSETPARRFLGRKSAAGEEPAPTLDSSAGRLERCESDTTAVGGAEGWCDACSKASDRSLWPERLSRASTAGRREALLDAALGTPLTVAAGAGCGGGAFCAASGGPF
jgi:hypothetical protein